MTEKVRGPGYARMADRLGAQKLEELRQKVLAEQRAALKDAAGTRPPAERDRTTYKTYPAPKAKPGK